MTINGAASRHREGVKEEGGPTRRQQGFTLIELLVVVSIMAIFSMVMVPSYQRMMAHQTLEDTSSALLIALMSARHQALTHHHPVMVCPRGSDHDCGQRWQEGWQIMMVDKDRSFRRIGGDVIDANLISDTYGTGSRAAPVMFNSTGYLASAAGGFRLSTDNDVRHVCISMSGRASIESRPCDL